MSSMDRLRALWTQPERLVAGLMSGTSLDGVDAVLARLSGQGRGVRIEQIAFASTPYPEAVRALLLRNSVPATSSVADLSQLNVRLAHIYAAAIRNVLGKAGLTLADLDLVGSHGQTVYHIPEATDCAGASVTSTLQIGDPSVLANLLGIPVVGDFRVADMALGGQGAPLVPHFDYACFADAHQTRGLLNLGGIANVSVLPAGADSTAVYAFDTGPANMLIDLVAQRHFGVSYDADGARAAQGTVHDATLHTWLADPYFAQPPPKSTGREYFGAHWLDAHGNADLTPHDLLATVTAFTAHSIHDAYQRFIAPQHQLDVLIASGGGRHNATLMRLLSDLFAPTRVAPIDTYGVDPDAKEALCFALLAHAHIDGIPTNVPSVTGASRPTLLGKLCLG